jgi:hypothetical protein
LLKRNTLYALEQILKKGDQDMKYRDVLILFFALLFILSLAYTIGVDKSIWFIPVILFISIILIFYKLWIEK